VFGDWDALTMTERRFFARAVPFYKWLRVISKDMARLPFEHPVRLAWTVTLADRFADGAVAERSMPFFHQGSVEVLGVRVPTVGLIPGADSVNPKNLTVGAVAPPINMLYRQLTDGKSLDGDFPAYLPKDENGDPAEWTPGTRAKVFFNDLLNTNNLTRHGSNPFGEKRYADGTPRTDADGNVQYQTRWEEGPLAGLPFLSEAVVRQAGVPYPAGPAMTEEEYEESTSSSSRSRGRRQRRSRGRGRSRR
jgi:hypothetical protein